MPIVQMDRGCVIGSVGACGGDVIDGVDICQPYPCAGCAETEVYADIMIFQIDEDKHVFFGIVRRGGSPTDDTLAAAMPFIQPRTNHPLKMSLFNRVVAMQFGAG